MQTVMNKAGSIHWLRLRWSKLGFRWFVLGLRWLRSSVRWLRSGFRWFRVKVVQVQVQVRYPLV